MPGSTSRPGAPWIPDGPLTATLDTAELQAREDAARKRAAFDASLRGTPEWDNSGPGEWWGQPRDYWKVGVDPAPGEDWIGFVPARDPEPSVLDAIGFVTCNCKLDNGIVVVYNPTCPVHQHYCKLP